MEGFMARKQKTHKFKKGDHIHLDQIYDIQGLGGGDWWESDGTEGEDGDNLIITKDIKITVIVETP